MRQREMDYYQTPSGQRLMLSVGHDMVRLNRALDGLRAQAYHQGVAPLYADDVPPPRFNPWETRKGLLDDLTDGLVRMDVLRQPRSSRYVGEVLRERAERLYHDICDHGNLLQKVDYITPQEHPKEAARNRARVEDPMKQLIADYESQKDNGPLPHVDARGAEITSPQPTHVKT